MGIPKGVRQVIGRTLSRLSTAANQFLAAASAFSGPFRFDAAAVAAGIEEQKALDAVDEALMGTRWEGRPKTQAWITKLRGQGVESLEFASDFCEFAS